jgi:hypothetical protein
MCAMSDERPRSGKAADSGMSVFGTISAKCAKSHAGDCAQWLPSPHGSHAPGRSAYLSATADRNLGMSVRNKGSHNAQRLPPR